MDANGVIGGIKNLLPFDPSILPTVNSNLTYDNLMVFRLPITVFKKNRKKFGDINTEQCEEYETLLSLFLAIIAKAKKFYITDCEQETVNPVSNLYDCFLEIVTSDGESHTSVFSERTKFNHSMFRVGKAVKEYRFWVLYHTVDINFGRVFRAVMRQKIKNNEKRTFRTAYKWIFAAD
ncbi:unnamed protein product, partial [marine sediment metagenome]